MRRIIVVLSDTHGGSRYGLCSPDARLTDDDRGEYAPTLTIGQRWLWDAYTAAIDGVLALAGKSRVDVVHNGDVCQGTRYPDGLMTTRLADHLAIAAANMAPWFTHKGVKSLTLVSGTGAHDFGEGSAEEAVACMLGRNVQMVSHPLLDVDGLSVDVAHHGPHTGIRAWTEGNVARLYLLDRLMRDDPPADVYVRSHRHDYVRVTLHGRYGTADLLVTPSWQLPGSYVRQVTQSASAVVCGLVALEVVDGRLAGVHPFTDKVDLRKRVTL